jgi:hypothetical protein
MRIVLQRGPFLRAANGAGSSTTSKGNRIMKYWIFALALVALAGCAQLNDGNAHAGATAAADDSPFPKRYPNPSYHTP